MGQKIERDHQRFRKLVRGKVKSNLRKYISRGEMIGKKGKDLVQHPACRRSTCRSSATATRAPAASGRGRASPASRSAPRQGEPGPGAGDQPGGHILEVELTMEEMAAILGEELALPRIEPRGKKNIVTTQRQATPASARPGPESLRHFKRTFKRALKRQIASRHLRPASIRSSSRSARTSSTAAGRKSTSRRASPSSST